MARIVAQRSKQCAVGEGDAPSAVTRRSAWQAADLADAPVTALALPGLLPVAMSMALELEHPICDCFYLSAAAQWIPTWSRLIGASSRSPPLARR
jgi:hypothetical protein